MNTPNWDEARALSQLLEQVEQPLFHAELALLRAQKQRLCYDGDLTGLPVSNRSRTYPNAAFGHMDDAIRLGYQAAVVSMASPTYGRLWLSGAHHPGDTVSNTQAEALVLAAEARTGLRPRRRTELLRRRIAAFERQTETTQQRLMVQEKEVQTARDRLAEARQQVLERQAILATVKESYRLHQRKERPTSHLAQARKRLEAAEHRWRGREPGESPAGRRATPDQDPGPERCLARGVEAPSGAPGPFRA